MGGAPVKTERCARCTKVIVDGRYALSRLDNESHLCPSCGQDEGMWNMLVPNTPLPPLGQMAAYWSPEAVEGRA